MNNSMTLAELIEALIELETNPRCMSTTPTGITDIKIHDYPVRHLSFIGVECEQVEQLEREIEDLKEEITSREGEIEDLKAQVADLS